MTSIRKYKKAKKKLLKLFVEAAAKDYRRAANVKMPLHMLSATIDINEEERKKYTWNFTK